MNKNQNAVMLRYVGADHARRFLLQRGDFAYWTGSDWSKIRDNAKIFSNYRAAATACSAIQYKQYKGKAIRTFKAEVSFTLAADEVGSISKEAMRRYIAEALRLDVENSVFGDGPVEGSFVEARLNLLTLEETKPRRKVF